MAGIGRRWERRRGDSGAFVDGLVAGEGGGAFFEECGYAFGFVAGVAEGAEVVRFKGQGFVEWECCTFTDG